jgi:hypothetical protein
MWQELEKNEAKAIEKKIETGFDRHEHLDARMWQESEPDWSRKWMTGRIRDPSALRADSGECRRKTRMCRLKQGMRGRIKELSALIAEFGEYGMRMRLSGLRRRLKQRLKSWHGRVPCEWGQLAKRLIMAHESAGHNRVVHITNLRARW